MSRNENENVDFLDLPDPNPTIAHYYLKDGVVIDREEYNKLEQQPPICAKVVQNTETNIVTYFVLCNNRNQMFDPKEIDTRYRTRNTWKFRRVKKSTFDLYVKFLQQNYRSFLSQAERGL